MAKRSGMYGRNKRQKELKRKKKKEEKELRRKMKAENSSQDAEGTESADIQPELPENASEIMDNSEATEIKTE
jgi:hypothetical protein